MHDDLGTEISLPAPPQRIVSLVPSLTEALAVEQRDRLIGATDWCIAPADLDVVRVRGTKNPDTNAIAALKPDLVIANKEENRRLDVERLRDAGVRVWVTDIETVDSAFASMRRLWTEALATKIPAWLIEAEAIWAEPARIEPMRVACCVWRDPWMVVGRDTFTGDLMSRLGLENVFASAEGRYPKVEVADIEAGAADAVLLPDEPYVFTTEDGPEAFSKTRTVLCSGQDLTWYGPRLLTARADLESVLG